MVSRNPRAERVPGTGNGPAGNSPTRYRRVSGYDPFLTTDSFVAQSDDTFSVSSVQTKTLTVRSGRQVHITQCHTG